MEKPTNTEIDDALVECLRIFARRGRQVREAREKLGGKESSSVHAEISQSFKSEAGAEGKPSDAQRILTLKGESDL